MADDRAMMKNIELKILKAPVLLWSCILLCSLSDAQSTQLNLVPNPGFEDYQTCPTGTSLEEMAGARPDHWYKPDKRGARYFNACANGYNFDYNGMPVNVGAGGYDFQYARSGYGYVVLFYYNGQDARNYLQVELSDSLRPGKCYYAEYYVNLLNSYRLGCDNHSMLFTKTPEYVDTNAVPAVYIMPANPQVKSSQIVTDTLNWVKVSGVFTAEGGEKFLTLGNFYYNSQTSIQQIQSTGYYGAAYYIEDVSVIPLDSFPLAADAGPDRTIPVGTSTYIGSYTSGLSNVTWYNSAGTVIAASVPGLNVTPSASTFYVIEQTVCGQYSRDTVFVNVQALPLNILGYSVGLVNQTNVAINWTTTNELNVSHFNIRHSDNGFEFSTIGKLPAKNSLSNEYRFLDNTPVNGDNYYRLESVDKDGKRYYSAIKHIRINIPSGKLSISPNPAKGVAKVKWKNIVQVRVLDLIGRRLLTENYVHSDEVLIDLSALTKGIYLVEVINDQSISEVTRIFIE